MSHPASARNVMRATRWPAHLPGLPVNLRPVARFMDWFTALSCSRALLAGGTSGVPAGDNGGGFSGLYRGQGAQKPLSFRGLRGVQVPFLAFPARHRPHFWKTTNRRVESSAQSDEAVLSTETVHRRLRDCAGPAQFVTVGDGP
jgi:hypothetical protein